jgi:aminoglycoside phosphotransferase (APT) family kinase protein
MAGDIETNESEFSAVVAAVAPGWTLVRTATFPGGLSALMTVMHAVGPSGVTRRFVVRQPRDPGAERGSLSMADEFGLLVALHHLGLPTLVPLLLDDSGRIFDHPYAVYDYVDGSPRVTTTDPVGTGRAFAAQLAVVHGVDGSHDACAGLPSRTADVGRRLAADPEAPDEAMGEEFLRHVLRTRWPPPKPDRTTLLHGDFWAGNLLWRDDAIVAVIDWEEAATGDPLTDVATTRLDLLWAFGAESMSAFTDHYLSLTSVSPDQLALWDVAAGLRPAGAFSSWVADWADFGRPDMNARTMRQRHRWFIDQALEAL